MVRAVIIRSDDVPSAITGRALSMPIAARILPFALQRFRYFKDESLSSLQLREDQQMNSSEIAALRELINEIAGDAFPRSDDASDVRSFFDLHGPAISQLLALSDQRQIGG